MKKLLLAGAATVALTTAAFAADPIVVVEEVIAPPPADIWDGLFVGLLGGYGWAQDGLDADSYAYHDLFIDPIRKRPGEGSIFLSDEDNAWASDEGDGWFGGGLIGFNVQNGNFVFGAEADISFADIGVGSSTVSTYADVYYEGRQRRVCEIECAPQQFALAEQAVVAEDVEGPRPMRIPRAPLYGSTASTTSADANIDWYGTARLKAGYAIDNILFYGSGGLAFGQVDLNGVVNTRHQFGNGNVSTQSSSFSDSSTELGWVLEGGVDVALTPNFIVGAFYRYVDLGSVSGGASKSDGRNYPALDRLGPLSVSESGTGSGSASADASFHAVGARAVFKFDSSSWFN